MSVSLRAPRGSVALAAAAFLLLGIAAPDARAQSWPSRPVRMVVGFAPGGAADVAARIVARRLAEQIGQQVLIENRAGAGGIVAMEASAKAAPDGHTIHLATNGPLVVSPHAQKNLPYDVRRDVSLLTMAVTFSNVVVVNPAVPARDLREWLDLGRAKPGTLAYASSGIASTGHLAGELLRLRSNVELTHVAYKGGAPAVQDLLGGQIGTMFATVPTALPHVKAGRLRAIAVTTARRSDALPDVPTIAEQGFAGFDAQNWYAFVGPGRMSRELQVRLNGELVRALRSADVREQLLANGFEPVPSTIEELTGFVERELEVWGRVVRQSGIRME